MKKTAIFGAVMLACVAVSAHAEGVRLRPFVGVGVTKGGGNLATAQYTGSTSVTLKAGDELAFKTGLDISFTPTVSGQFNVGYHTAESSSSNGSVKFTRIPVELLGHMRLADVFRLGAGVRTTLHGRMTGTGDVGRTNQSFSTSFGLVFEGDYFVTQGLALTARYVAEKYKYNGSGASVSGNHAGAYLTYYFN